MYISVVFKRIFKIKRSGEREKNTFFFSISKSNNEKEVNIKLSFLSHS